MDGRGTPEAEPRRSVSAHWAGVREGESIADVGCAGLFFTSAFPRSRHALFSLHSCCLRINHLHFFFSFPRLTQTPVFTCLLLEFFSLLATGCRF